MANFECTNVVGDFVQDRELLGLIMPPREKIEVDPAFLRASQKLLESIVTTTVSVRGILDLSISLVSKESGVTVSLKDFKEPETQFNEINGAIETFFTSISQVENIPNMLIRYTGEKIAEDGTQDFLVDYKPVSISGEVGESVQHIPLRLDHNKK